MRILYSYADGIRKLISIWRDTTNEENEKQCNKFFKNWCEKNFPTVSLFRYQTSNLSRRNRRTVFLKHDVQIIAFLNNFQVFWKQMTTIPWIEFCYILKSAGKLCQR